MVHNLVFRWPTPYFSMGFGGAHGIYGIGLQPHSTSFITIGS